MTRLLSLLFTSLFLAATSIAQVQIITEGSSGNDLGLDVTVASNGDVIAVGAYSQDITLGSGGSQVTLQNTGSLDGFVARYDSQGSIDDAVRIHGGSQIAVEEVAVDGSGNIVVSGGLGNGATFGEGDFVAQSDLGFGDAFIARYANDLSFDWARTFGTAAEVYGLASTTAGDIYASGIFRQEIRFPSVSDTTFLDGNPNTNIRTGFLVKYDPAGAFEWVATFKNPVTSVFMTSLAVDNSGAYACGSIISADTTTISTGVDSVKAIAPGVTDLFAIKFDGDGGIDWFETDGNEDAVEGCSGIDVNQSGDVFITGPIALADAEIGGQVIPLSDFDTYVAKFDASWNLDWVKTTSFEIDETAANSDGGLSLYADFNEDVITMRYNSQGYVDFLRVDGGVHPERAGGIALDPNDGSMWITGSYATGQLDVGAEFGCGDQEVTVNGTQDIFLIEYDDSPCGSTANIPITGANTVLPFDTGEASGSIEFTAVGTSTTVDVSFASGPIPDQSGLLEFLATTYTIAVDGTGSTANLTLPYSSSDIAAFNSPLSTLQLFRNDGGSWTNLGASADTLAQELTATGVSVFGQFAIGRDILATGLDEKDIVRTEDRLRVFPNPARQSATITTALRSPTAKLEVYDTLGRLSYSATVHKHGETQRLDLDLSTLGSGVYLIRLVEFGRIRTGSVVVK